MQDPYQTPKTQEPTREDLQKSKKDVNMILPVGRSGWAIAAGYLGLFGLAVIPAPVALIVSTVAVIDIERSRKTATPKQGMGRAIFGLSIGIFGTCLLFFILSNQR